MRILADENADAPLVGWLREIGHDVLWAVEHAPGSSDTQLMALAIAEQRVLVTLDRDFGELVFRHGMRPPGVVLVRLRARSAAGLVAAFQKAWPRIEERALGHFTVASRGRIRVRPL